MPTLDDFRNSTAPEGFYLFASPHHLFVVEVDSDGVAHQLNPKTLQRDGVLSPEGWEANSPLVAIHGPFARSEPESVILDSFQPDHKHRCTVCGNTPVVTGVRKGKVVYQSDLCGPCTWGEAAMLDPSKWNE